MKLWKWQRGRQDKVKYWKFPLWYFRIGKFGFDAYVLKYEPFTRLPWHTDPVDGKHWRLNVPIKGFARFEHVVDGIVYTSYQSILFRPDVEAHMLQVFDKGCTKLSFGFVKFN